MPSKRASSGGVTRPRMRSSYSSIASTVTASRVNAYHPARVTTRPAAAEGRA
jgi:hypothetical protein